MAGYGAFFQDLDLIMDHNLHRALAMVPSSSAPMPPSNSEPEHVSAFEDQAVAVSEEEVAVRFGNPLSSAASISLALSSVLSSSLVLSKSSAMMPPALQQGVGPAISGVVGSQKKSYIAAPVMASSKVQVVLDIPVARPIVTKSRNYASAFPEYEKLQGPGFKDPANAAGLRRVSIVWFRNDLRVHDNEALVKASRESVSILPVFCFNPQDYGKSDKNSRYRGKFLIECVGSLRSSLRERGSDLVVRVGKPELVLVDLAKSVGADAVYAHQEVSYEELQAEEKVAAALQEKGVETNYFWGSTLFHLEDVPFKVQGMPDSRTEFKETVQNVAVRNTIKAPDQLKRMPASCGGNVNLGHIPSLEELGFYPAANLPQGGGGVGGEEEALKRLQKFALDVANQTSKPKTTKRLRFRAKFAPWLATGCLSPRQLFEDVQNSGSSAGAMAGKASGSGSKDKALKWLVLELVWRDFFRFITKKYRSRKKLSASTPVISSTATLAA